MKKTLILLVIITLLLSACGSETPVDEGLNPDMVATVATEMMAATVAAQEAEAAAQAAVAPTETPVEAAVPAPTISTDFENAAPIQTQLIIGIFQLENTALAITTDQANLLYTQFLALQTSMTNQTLTEEEMDLLTLQQEAVLNAEQIQAINALQITQESVMTTMQELGFEAGGRGSGGTPPTDGSAPQGGGGAPPTDGSAPQGGSGQGGGGETGTAPEGREERNNFVSPELLNAIISLLESKINN